MTRTLLPLLAVLLVLPSPGVASACAGADTTPAAQGGRAAAAATLCLINAARAERGLGGLRRDHRLARAGRGHVADMLGGGFFSHGGPDGRDTVQRIADAGYVTGPGRMLGGENLAWARDRYDTPRQVVEGWIDSAAHNRTMFHRPFIAAAVVVRRALPTQQGPGSTYALELGG